MKSLSTFGIIVCVVLLFTPAVVIANGTECNITIDKKCLVVRPFDCTYAKPIDSLSMIWSGTENIRIKAWKGSVGSTLLADIDGIAPSDEVTVTGFAGSPNDVYWEIFAASTDTKIGESTFHLSCSDDDMNGPEDCSKFEGDGKNKEGYINDWIFEGMAGNGLALDCTPAELAPSDQCEFEAPPPPNCETAGDPTSLTFRYTGADCTADDNDQAADKYLCSGVPGASPVSITIEKDPSMITVSPSSELNVGDLVTVSAIGSDMGSEIKLYVGDQFLKIHTSCSQPLAAGDVFGSLELVQFNGQSSGAEVTYSYKVTNNGTSTVDVTSVFDDKLGELLETPPVPLGASKSITLEKTAFISESTTNKVTATAEVSDTGQTCGEATDQVTVTMTEPTRDVSVDIKPGSYPNCLNMNGHGLITVAILGSDTLDVSQIEIPSLKFAGLNVRVKGNSNPQCSIEDVSGDFTDPAGVPDGYDDLVCHFIDDPSVWSPDNGTATLSGVLLDGTQFKGADTICIVP